MFLGKQAEFAAVKFVAMFQDSDLTHNPIPKGQAFLRDLIYPPPAACPRSVKMFLHVTLEADGQLCLFALQPEVREHQCKDFGGSSATYYPFPRVGLMCIGSLLVTIDEFAF